MEYIDEKLVFGNDQNCLLFKRVNSRPNLFTKAKTDWEEIKRYVIIYQPVPIKNSALDYPIQIIRSYSNSTDRDTFFDGKCREDGTHELIGSLVKKFWFDQGSSEVFYNLPLN